MVKCSVGINKTRDLKGESTDPGNHCDLPAPPASPILTGIQWSQLTTDPTQTLILIWVEDLWNFSFTFILFFFITLFQGTYKHRIHCLYFFLNFSVSVSGAVQVAVLQLVEQWRLQIAECSYCIPCWCTQWQPWRIHEEYYCYNESCQNQRWKSLPYRK